MTVIALAAESADQIKANAVVVGVAAGPDGRPVVVPGSRPIDVALRRRLVATLVSLGATGAAGECHRIATLGATAAPVVVVVGLGTARRGQEFAPEVLRRAAGVALRSLAGTDKVAISLGTAGDGTISDEAASAVAEGALLGAYSYRRYRYATLHGYLPPVRSVVVLVGGPVAAIDSASSGAGEDRLRRGVHGPRPGEHPAVRPASSRVRRNRDTRKRIGPASRSRCSTRRH